MQDISQFCWQNQVQTLFCCLNLRLSSANPKFPGIFRSYLQFVSSIQIYSHSRHIFPFGSPKSPTFSRQNPAWHTSSVSCRCSAKAFLRRSISASRCSTMAWLRRGRILVPMALNGLEIEDKSNKFNLDGL